MDELNVYLQNHWAAAAGGEDLARRVARTHRGTHVGPDFALVAPEVVEDREALGTLMRLLGLDPGAVAPAVVRVAERVGRLEPDGHLVRRSPASDVLELEALRAVVAAKRAGWEALLALGRRPGPDRGRRAGAAARPRRRPAPTRLAEAHATLARSRLARAV